MCEIFASARKCFQRLWERSMAARGLRVLSQVAGLAARSRLITKIVYRRRCCLFVAARTCPQRPCVNLAQLPRPFCPPPHLLAICKRRCERMPQIAAALILSACRQKLKLTSLFHSFFLSVSFCSLARGEEDLRVVVKQE